MSPEVTSLHLGSSPAGASCTPRHRIARDCPLAVSFPPPSSHFRDGCHSTAVDTRFRVERSIDPRPTVPGHEHALHFGGWRVIRRIAPSPWLQREPGAHPPGPLVGRPERFLWRDAHAADHYRCALNSPTGFGNSRLGDRLPSTRPARDEQARCLRAAAGHPSLPAGSWPSAVGDAGSGCLRIVVPSAPTHDRGPWSESCASERAQFHGIREELMACRTRFPMRACGV
jgi:hypothetical protein